MLDTYSTVQLAPLLLIPSPSLPIHSCLAPLALALHPYPPPLSVETDLEDYLGEFIRLHALKFTWLNGMIGTVLCLETTSRRFGVLPASGQQKAIRTYNLAKYGFDAADRCSKCTESVNF